MNVKQLAGSEGQTPREFLKYCHRRIHQRDINTLELFQDLQLIETVVDYLPTYVKLWLKKRKVNGFAHKEIPVHG